MKAVDIIKTGSFAQTPFREIILKKRVYSGTQCHFIHLCTTLVMKNCVFLMLYQQAHCHFNNTNILLLGMYLHIHIM